MRSSMLFVARLVGLALAIALSGCSAPSTGHGTVNGTDNGNGNNVGGNDGTGGSGGSTGGIDNNNGAVDGGAPGGDLAGAPAGSGGNNGALDGGTPDAAPPASVITEFAPYFYTWGWGSSSYAFSTLADMKKQGGPSAVTIAFVLSDGGCNTTTDIQSNLTDVKAFIAAGGHVKASFGGADGTYLENGCKDAPSLASAISAFVDATGITDLDFDIEQGSTSSNATINAMRATALKSVQDAKNIRVAFTLPVNPDGLDSLGLAVVSSALAAKVKISYVNVMTMDYGSSTNLGTTPISSADATAKQLQSLISGLSLDDAYRMVGVTPMIGHNDDSESFTIANAQTLATYAQQKHLGLLAFWAIQRDEKCPTSTVDLDTCTGVNTSTFQFSKILTLP